MRVNLRALFGGPTPWTCSRCIRSDTLHESRRMLSNGPRRVVIKKKIRPIRPVLLAAAGGTLGAGVLFTDEIKHGYTAAERSGRVITTLAICINDYRTTLKQQSDDADEADTSLKACHKRCAGRTLRVLEKNGSIFIKLGQHLSSMGYLLPYEWTTTFVPLQDKCPVSSYESIEEMFLKDTGHRIEDDFDDFSREPIGAASLAQVHTALLKDTDCKVAVKVQHPTLAEWVPLDLALTRFTFSTLKRVFPEYDLSWLSDEMEFSLPQELDFALEGANAMAAKKYFKSNTSFPLIIPEVISSSARILVMDYITGCRPDNLSYLDANHISRDEVSATLARIFNTMIFAPGAPLHCDPHGGNIAIRPNPSRRYPYNFDVVLYDHGLYRVPDAQLRRSYAHLWLAVINADEDNMRKYAYELAGITDEQFPLFASAITGRDYRVLTKKGAAGVAATARDSKEKDAINDAFGDGLLQQLVQLLGKVPRIILLILKTNDLTRSLDEGLQTTQGPERTFLILAKYASWAVWEEEVEGIKGRKSGKQLGGLWWVWPGNLVRLCLAWSRFMRVEFKLWGYERYLASRRVLGIQS